MAFGWQTSSTDCSCSYRCRVDFERPYSNRKRKRRIRTGSIEVDRIREVDPSHPIGQYLLRVVAGDWEAVGITEIPCESPRDGGGAYHGDLEGVRRTSVRRRLLEVYV